jgi:carbamate kinase
VRIVVALGGNALLQRGEKPDAAVQLRHVQTAAQVLAPLAREHDLLICHGNGPQVGMLALESENDSALSRPYPLDDLVAQTQGMIGYWLAQSLHNAGVRKSILSIVTQTEVDRADPSFTAPTKFVGSGYPREQAQALSAEHGWRIAKDGQHWRRVVASPDPRRVVEQRAISDLLEAGTVVICGGGGGAAVTVDTDGQLAGVEAVIDKDYVAALLAVIVHADRLLVLTDVSAVMMDFGTPLATPLAHLDLEQIGTMAFPAGSMQPKVEACRRFVAATGKLASIGALADAKAVLAGTVGTTISRGDRAPTGVGHTQTSSRV